MKRYLKLPYCFASITYDYAYAQVKTSPYNAAQYLIPVFHFVKVTSHGVFPTPFRIRNEAATISSNSMPTGLLVSPPKPICFSLFLSSSEKATEVRG